MSTTPLPLFDGAGSMKRKYEGMDAAARARIELLELVRLGVKGVALGRESREVTADDAMDWLDKAGHKPEELGNAAGSIFRESCWTFTGEWRESTRKSNHARMNRVWRLR